MEVRQLTNPSFVMLWRRNPSIFYSVFKNNRASSPAVLVATNCDSTEYDFASGLLVWTSFNTSGNRSCLTSYFNNPGGLSNAAEGTIKCSGDISYPRLMNSSTMLGLTFDLREGSDSLMTLPKLPFV